MQLCEFNVSNYQYNWVVTISAYFDQKKENYCQITEDSILCFQLKKKLLKINITLWYFKTMYSSGDVHM
jgi:hypothetical protein